MPFVNPVTVQVVANVVHTVAPLEDVTTYVRGVVFETAVQLSVTLLLATDAERPVGEIGGPCGVTEVDDAPFPLAFEATAEMT
jgi:hypothetical protein